MKFKMVPLKDLTIDRRYQRELDAGRVKAIAEAFDPRLLGVLEVSRHNGKCAVFDGQHRLAALKKIKGANTAPCLVHEQMTPQEEAELFVLHQTKRRGIQSVERFRARVFAGDPVAVAIEGIVNDCGFEIGSGQKESEVWGIRAVTAIERVYTKYGAESLEAVLRFIAAVWGGDQKSTDGSFIGGVHLLLTGYGDRVQAAEIKRLRQKSPVDILRRASGRLGMMGGGFVAWEAVHGELRSVAGVRGRPRKAREVETATA